MSFENFVSVNVTQTGLLANLYGMKGVCNGGARKPAEFLGSFGRLARNWGGGSRAVVPGRATHPRGCFRRIRAVRREPCRATRRRAVPGNRSKFVPRVAEAAIRVRLAAHDNAKLR